MNTRRWTVKDNVEFTCWTLKRSPNFHFSLLEIFHTDVEATNNVSVTSAQLFGNSCRIDFEERNISLKNLGPVSWKIQLCDPFPGKAELRPKRREAGRGPFCTCGRLHTDHRWRQRGGDRGEGSCVLTGGKWLKRSGHVAIYRCVYYWEDICLIFNFAFKTWNVKSNASKTRYI